MGRHKGVIFGAVICILLATGILAVSESRANASPEFKDTMFQANNAVTPMGQSSATEKPFQAFLSLPLFDSSGIHQATFTVPTGNHLVFDFVGASPLDPPASEYQIETIVNGVDAAYPLVLTTIPGGTVVSESIHIYADPGTTVRINVFYGLSQYGKTVQFSLSGHLIP
jgi:hypothetical protein